MKSKLKTAPKYFPITLAGAKSHLNIDFDDQDEYIKRILVAATGKAEQFLHRRLITQTWKLYLDSWPWATSFDLPFGRLQSVTSIKYKDQDGAETTLDSSKYIVDTESEPGKIVLAYDESWPTETLYPSNPIEIEFICGYYVGPTWITITAYAENDQVMPVTENGLVYYASTAGTTGANEPTWPLEIGGTVTDGTVVWTCIGEQVPEAIRHAIKITLSDFYENRETEYFVPNFTKLKTFENLLTLYKLYGGVF